MAVYTSKFATKNVMPSTGRDHRHFKRFGFAMIIVAVVALSAFGFWRATAGTPVPVDLTTATTE